MACPASRTFPRPRRAPLSTQFAWAMVLAFLIWSWEGADMRPLALFKDMGNMGHPRQGFLSAQFS